MGINNQWDFYRLSVNLTLPRQPQQFDDRTNLLSNPSSICWDGGDSTQVTVGALDQRKIILTSYMRTSGRLIGLEGMRSEAAPVPALVL